MKRFLSFNSMIYISISSALLLLLIAALFEFTRLSFYFILYFIFVAGFIFFGLQLLNERIDRESDRARSEQVRKILRVARQTLPYLRQGLTISSATRVAEAIFPETRAIAIAVTNSNKVLAFVGSGSDHHRQGKKIMTSATREALKTGKTMILSSADEIGCPAKKLCPLKAAIVVPLKQSGDCVGALKFYYGKEGKVSDAEIAIAEGFAHLLETQLELSQISRLETLACQAELKALQAQINPHFFFNVLNTAVSYCRSNPVEARRILLDFSNFFRTTLENGDESLITLDSELNYVTDYLELEKARFGERLIYNISVSTKALSWPIPPFTLQPIVENSINHGFPDDRPLIIDVKDHSTQDLRIIEVRDNGNGITAEKLPTVLLRGSGDGLGIGLSLINDRLKLLFGEEYGLTVDSVVGSWTSVRIVMPVNARIRI